MSEALIGLAKRSVIANNNVDALAIFDKADPL